MNIICVPADRICRFICAFIFGTTHESNNVTNITNVNCVNQAATEFVIIIHGV